MTENKTYGDGDFSYQSAGQKEGIRKLVDDFYEAMETLPQAEKILRMHPDDLSISRDKLSLFLCGWLGGPRLFREKYGPIQIPKAHAHLPIGEKEKQAWLDCMALALEKSPYPKEFRSYLLKELAVPAGRCVNQEV